MPEEHYTATEAADYLKVSRQTFYTWLHKDSALSAYYDEHHTLTKRQLDALAISQRKKPIHPTIKEVDAALTERIEAVERRLDALEKRLPDA